MSKEQYHPEQESYELLKKYGESLQSILKDFFSGKKDFAGITFTFRNKDEWPKIADPQQEVIIHSLTFDETNNIFNFKVGNAGFSFTGEAADLVKQGYKSEIN